MDVVWLWFCAMAAQAYGRRRRAKQAPVRFNSAACRKALSEILAEVREKKHMTQIDVGYRAGIPPYTMSRYEHGLRVIPFYKFVRIALALECSPEKLLHQVLTRAGIRQVDRNERP